MSTISLLAPALPTPAVSSSSSSSSESTLPSRENSILALRCVAVAETCGFKNFPFEADPSDFEQCQEVINIRQGLATIRNFHTCFEPLEGRETSSTYASYLFFKDADNISKRLNSAMDEELGMESRSNELSKLNEFTEKQEYFGDPALGNCSLGAIEDNLEESIWTGGGYEPIHHPIEPFYLDEKGFYNCNSVPSATSEQNDCIFKGFCYSSNEENVIARTLQRVWTRQSGAEARVENFTALIKEIQPGFLQRSLDLMAAYDGRIFFLTKVLR